LGGNKRFDILIFVFLHHLPYAGDGLDTQVFSKEVYDERREITPWVPQGYIGDLGLVGSFGHQDIIRNQKRHPDVFLIHFIT